MFRKFAVALVAVGFAFGSIFAEEIKGTFVSYKEGKEKTDPGILTLKVKGKDDKESEKEFKIPADLKMKARKGKDGKDPEDVAASERFKGIDGFMSKAKKNFPLTITLDVDKDIVKSAKVDASNFKKKTDN